jgi:DNA-binding MarR family transcriptional regulator/GNAT superfamily N-acetyltransferase
MDYLDPRIAAVRRFGRFYTARLGLLREGLLDTPFSLTESRILYELAARPGLAAADLARDLALDPGYLSRILRGFEKAGLLERAAAAGDARRHALRLSPKGQQEFSRLDMLSTQQAARFLADLPDAAAREVVQAMRRIEQCLDGAPPRGWVMRPPRPGDLGWVVAAHGRIYHEEFGYDASFEALVAEIAAAWRRDHDPAVESGWIAELDGLPVGSVFLVRQSAEVAKLRLLIVDPAARGLGIGNRLVAECTRFARAAGYRRITLWTHSILEAARRIYAAEGYRLVASEPAQEFGKALVSETWEMEV